MLVASAGIGTDLTRLKPNSDTSPASAPFQLFVRLVSFLLLLAATPPPLHVYELRNYAAKGRTNPWSLVFAP